MEHLRDNETSQRKLAEVRVVTPAPSAHGRAEEAAGTLKRTDIIAPTPWLGGARHEHLLTCLEREGVPESTGMWQWWTGGEMGLGAARLPLTDETLLEAQVAGLYRELLKHLKGWYLYRVWNYVPAINEWVGGQENYRRFNQGRAMAFQAHAGEQACISLPAASAVGAVGGDLVVYALFGKEVPEFFENPEQVPAYKYPAQYGPTPPSFARGGIVELGGQRIGFISGTAAIKGHESLAKEDLREQTRITLDNLRVMAERLGFAGVFEGTGAPGQSRFVRIFLRDPHQAGAALQYLAEAGLPLGDGEHTIVQADVCRAELDIEIEARLQAPVA